MHVEELIFTVSVTINDSGYAFDIIFPVHSRQCTTLNH